MAKKLSKLTEALLETVDDMYDAGLMSNDTHQKITVRHLGPDAPLSAEPITPEEIRRVRERAHLSQAALAKYTNLTTGYISQLERGTKKATGSTLAILNVIRHKGIEAVI